MPRRNRVTPLSDIVAHPSKEARVYGNRGCLHDGDGRIVRHHAGRRWIACRLAFKNRRRELMRPGRYTELFFLDEATALAAGHRPCAECRRADYDALGALWAELHPGDAGAGADAIDARLQPSASNRTAGPSAGTKRRSPICPTGRSCCATARRGWCAARTCADGRTAATPIARRGRGAERRPS